MNKTRKATLLLLQQNKEFAQLSEQKPNVNQMDKYQKSFNFIKDQSFSKINSIDFFDDSKVNGVSKKRAYLDSNSLLKYTLQVENKYNPYLIPPDWKAAEKHRNARRVGRDQMPQMINEEEIYDVCPCCDYQIEKSELSLKEQVNKLSFLGSGYPLFFHYIKYCIIILGLILLTSGEYNILSNYFGGSCMQPEEKQRLEDEGKRVSRKQCIADIISIWTIANKNRKVDYAEMQDILNFTTVIVLMILLFFFRKEQKEIDALCDNAELTPADYTIMMKNVPAGTTKSDIKEFFEGDSKQFDTELVVKEINFAYNLTDRLKKQRQIKQIIKDKKNALSKLKEYDDQFKKESIIWDKVINKEQQNLELINLKIEEDPSQFTGYVFVSFQTENQKDCVLNQGYTSLLSEICSAIFFQQTEFKNLKFYGVDIEIREASEPLDIIWENLDKSDNIKRLSRLLSFFITLVLFIICTVLIYVLIKFQADSLKEFQNEYENDLSKKDKDVKLELKLLFLEQIPSAIVSFCMVCINSVVIEILFRQIVKLESYNTYTLFNINLAQKLSLALFINTALITCFMNIFYTKNIFGKGGLIYTIFYFFFVNAGSSFMSLLVDPMRYYKKILVWYFKRQGVKCTLTQQEANKLCEMPPHEIEMGYVDVMKTIYITIFYSSVVPVGVIISFIGFCLYYWSQKYIILRQCSVDKQISVKLSLEMTEYLEFIISIYTASNLIFKYQTIGSLSQLQIAGFFIGILYSVMPIQLMVDKIFFFGNDNEQIHYDIAYPFFVTTYAMSNPVTAAKAKKRHYQKTQDQYFQK